MDGSEDVVGVDGGESHSPAVRPLDVGQPVTGTHGGAGTRQVEPDAVAALLVQCRTQEGRKAALESLATGLTPSGIDPVHWTQWLSGGEPPFGKPPPKRPSSHGQALGRDLERQSGAIERATRAVDKARTHRDRLNAEVEQAEATLSRVRAEEQAMMHHAVDTGLRELLAPMFAMGPAWTVMRALSGHVPDEEMAEELKFEKDPARRATRERQLRTMRREETDRLFGALDGWAGDANFEYAVRNAIVNVISEYARRRGQLPPRFRVRKVMQTSVADGELIRDMTDILDGFSPGR